MDSFSERVRDIVKRIPPGRVATYGQIAARAGDHRAARQVAWILHSSSRQYQLPWHRVVNRHGRISLKKFAGCAEQRCLLECEGVEFDDTEAMDLERYLWHPV
jgi:methylated-DNA-protein-cysteine methyltransferase-like protein